MLRAALLSLILATGLLADGGAVQVHAETGPFAITLFASPSPLRCGPADLSVLVQDRESLAALVDARVTLRLWHGETELTVDATRAQAQNKLLYAAAVNFPDAGDWNYSVTVRRGSSQATVSGSAAVAAHEAGLSSHWASIALAPLCMLIFGFHQFLSRRVGVAA